MEGWNFQPANLPVLRHPTFHFSSNLPFSAILPTIPTDFFKFYSDEWKDGLLTLQPSPFFHPSILPILVYSPCLSHAHCGFVAGAAVECKICQAVRYLEQLGI